MKTLRYLTFATLLLTTFLFSCAKDEGSDVTILFDLEQVGTSAQSALMAIIKESDTEGLVDVTYHTEISPISELRFSTEVINEPGSGLVLVMVTFPTDIAGTIPLFLSGEDVPANYVQLIPAGIYQSALESGATLRALSVNDRNEELVRRFAEMIYYYDDPEATPTPSPEPTATPTSTPSPRPTATPTPVIDIQG